jgi:putative ABC transport system permease protein
MSLSSIRLSDLIRLSWSALRRNRLRSFLTIGAIGFGVGILVFLLSLGAGLQQLTIGSILKSNSLTSFEVTSFNPELRPLRSDTVTDVAAVPNVTAVYPRLTAKGEVSLGGSSVLPVTIAGVDSGYFDLLNNKPFIAGRPFSEGDTTSIVVTTAFLNAFNLVNTSVPLLPFTLTLDREYGSIAPISDVAVRGIIQDDTATAIYLSREYLEGVLLGASTDSTLPLELPDYEHLKVSVNSLDAITSATDQVIARGYRIATTIDTVDQIRSTFWYIQLTLGILGLIAIIVASIGMFNTLTVSLLERTREIGIMKALGVKRGDVRKLFLVEAVLIGLVGGLLGVSLAFVLQQITYFIFEVLAAVANGKVPMLFQNEWYLLAGAMGFSLVIAVATGLYPAQRAAMLNPITAIRHE